MADKKITVPYAMHHVTGPGVSQTGAIPQPSRGRSAALLLVQPVDKRVSGCQYTFREFRQVPVLMEETVTRLLFIDWFPTP